MKVGDKVKLSSKGKKEYDNSYSNPHNLIGEIYKIELENYPYFVKWSNGKTNSYESYELELVTNDYKFQVGDKVKLKTGKAHYIIHEINGDNVKLCLDNKFYTRKLDELELVLSYKDLVSSHNPELKEQSSKELNGLPKYWIVKNDTSNPLWIKFIGYVRTTYGYNVGNVYKYYGYDGSPIGINGFNCFDDRGHFKNDPTLITLEQWNAVVSKSDEIKKLTLEQPIKPTDNLGTITTDYHGNFLHTNYGTMSAINKLNDIRSEKFFSNEKNLTAIETLNDTLESGVKLMEDSIKELMDSKDKFEKLIHKLDTAANESDVSLLKVLISQIDEVKFFVKQLEETKIEKYKQAAESAFSIKEFLSSKK